MPLSIKIVDQNIAVAPCGNCTKEAERMYEEMKSFVQREEGRRIEEDIKLKQNTEPIL